MDRAENVPGKEGVETREITIAGMGCDNCAKKLERALRAHGGVKAARVDGIAGRATVTFDRRLTNIPKLQEVVAKSGYRAGAAVEGDQAAAAIRPDTGACGYGAGDGGAAVRICAKADKRRSQGGQGQNPGKPGSGRAVRYRT